VDNKTLNNKVDLLEKQINNVFDLLKSGNIAFTKDIPDIDQETEITSKLNNRIDELESKNYQLKADIDRIIKAIEYYKLEVTK